MAKKIKGIEDLTPDVRNANRGTQRGRGMVEASLREVGAGRYGLCLSESWKHFLLQNF